MEKKFTSRETAMLKRVYQNVDANYQKVKKLTFKRNELQKEIDSLMEEIELTDAPVVKKFGYSSVDLVKKVINPLFNEDGSPKCDKDGHPIKQTKYVLIYPDTIIPPVVEEESIVLVSLTSEQNLDIASTPTLSFEGLPYVQ